MDLRLNKSSPFRPFDWRYQRAASCAEEGLHRLRAHDDFETKNLRYFLRCLRACRAAAAEDECNTKMTILWRAYAMNPDLWHAFEIYNQRPSGLRAIFEARLLAGELFESIARKVGANAGIISWHGAAFFDVRERLTQRDLIYAALLSDEDSAHDRESNRGRA